MRRIGAAIWKISEQKAMPGTTAGRGGVNDVGSHRTVRCGEFY